MKSHLQRLVRRAWLNYKEKKNKGKHRRRKTEQYRKDGSVMRAVAEMNRKNKRLAFHKQATV